MPKKPRQNLLFEEDLPLVKHLREKKKNRVKEVLPVFKLPDPQPGPQTEFLNTSADICIYGGAAGGGKAEPCYGLHWAFQNIKEFTVEKYHDILHLVPEEIRDMDSKVLMWNGEWKNMSEIAVGDRIMNPDGQHQEVLQVHERGARDIYQLFFEDGTTAECCEEHLWSFWEAREDSRKKTREGRKPILDNTDPTNWNINYISRARVRETKWLINELAKGRRFIFPITAPLNYTHISRGRADRAYLYGALIGDGYISSKHGISLVTADEWIKERALSLVEDYRIYEKEGKNLPLTNIAFKDAWVKTWARNSELLDKKAKTKFLPKGYLKESLEFRWNLAQGLFDTDGYASMAEKNEVSYCTISPQLAYDIALLVRSLGFIAKTNVKKGVCYTGGHKEEKEMAFIVTVEGNDRWRLFSLPRKVEAAKNHEPNNWVGKRLVNIFKTDQRIYSRCITVSNPNSLYITDGYNVTHNSWALLRKALNHIDNPGYGAVIFRRTSPEITTEGGLWDESGKLYSLIPGAKSREGKLDWTFPSGASISFGHAQHEKDVENKFPGAQIAYIGFDELNKFTEKQFWFLFSRNRTTCGVKPRIDATCNPDADSWVAKLIDWWIDPQTGYPILERGGKLRYFYRIANVLHWADDPDTLIREFPDLAKIAPPKSLTFIPATLDDNRILLDSNPEYKSNLLGLLSVDMERLLKGNWKIKWSAGLVFNRQWFEIVDELPTNLTSAHFVRFWDLASTAKEVANNSTCYTACQKWMRVKINGEYVYYILDCYWEQLGAETGDDQMVVLAQLDDNNKLGGKKTKIRWELEGGSAARRHEAALIKKIKQALPDADCKGVVPLGDKLTRAKPWALSAKAGQIKILRAWWNEQFLASVDQFDGTKKTPPVNDIVDAGSGAYSCISQVLSFGEGLGDVK